MKSIFGKALFIFFCGTLLITGNDLFDIESLIGYFMIGISIILILSGCFRKKTNDEFQFN